MPLIKQAFLFKITLVVLLSLFFSISNLQAQSKKRILRKARHFADKADFYSSKEEYLKLLKKDSLHKAGNMEIGLILNEYLENPAEAGFYLKRGERACKQDTVPELVYEIGRYYHMTGNYVDAKRYFKKLLRYFINTKEGLMVRTIILKDIADCDYAIKNSQFTNHRFIVNNIGGEVNTYFPEYVPVATADNRSLIFTSRRKGSRSKKVDYADMKYFEDVFLAKHNNGVFQDSVLFLQDGTGFSKIKNSDVNESIISISHDGKKLFFFKHRRVLESDFDGTNWSEPRKLAKNINFDFYQNHASITLDGNTIYFTSETKKGENGSDIYMATKDEKGIWSEAINLGEAINTTFDEDSPFIDVDGTTLYFSSDGREGYGGYDIYKSTFDGKTWSTPINMGLPLNSPCDDFDFTINDFGSVGYLSSGRVGGFGDLDIYRFSYDACEKFEDSNNQFVQKDSAILCAPITFDATSIQLTNETILGNYWFINDSFLLKDSKKLTHTFAEKGIYNVKIQVRTKDHNYCATKQVNVKYTIAQADSVLASNTNSSNNSNYNSNSNNNNSNNSNNNSNSNSNNSNNSNNNSNSSNSQITLHTIYFELNNSGLTPDAINLLDKTVEYLKSNSTKTINLSAYADSRGSRSYNLNLSAQRSNAIVKYLVKNGVKRKQIKQIKNLGESGLVNNCADGVECNENDHFQNRRVVLFETILNK